MRIVALLVLAVAAALPGYAEETAARAEAVRPSVAETKAVEFLGKKFELKFKATDNPVRVYEYYLAKETPDDWLEMVAFQLYPVNLEGNAPLALAKRTAALFMEKYPYMKYALASNTNGVAMLDYFYPISSRKEKGKRFLEFNAFKFYRDAASAQTMSVHYAKNIESTSSSRTMNDVLGDIKKTREELLEALPKFPLHRP